MKIGFKKKSQVPSPWEVCQVLTVSRLDLLDLVSCLLIERNIVLDLQRALGRSET